MGRQRDHVTPPPWAGDPALVLPVRADPAGEAGPTRKQARGPHWRRVSQGLYVPAATEQSPRQRILEAWARVGLRGAVTGWAALHLWGAKWCDGTRADGTFRTVPLVVEEHGIRSVPQITLSEEGLPLTHVARDLLALPHPAKGPEGPVASVRPGPLPPDWLTTVDGFTVTSPARSACFEARHASSLREAVSWLDRATAADIVSIEELEGFLRTLTGASGATQCRKAVALAAENAWSPTETTMRLVLIQDLGLTDLLCNTPVFDAAGHHLGTPDVIDPAIGVAWEYDGEVHWRQRSNDLDRQTRFTAAGLETVSMVACDLRDPAAFRVRTRHALAAASRRPASDRRWTVTPPPWWHPTTTVEQRRALTARDRQRLLGWQAA